MLDSKLDSLTIFTCTNSHVHLNTHECEEMGEFFSGVWQGNTRYISTSRANRERERDMIDRNLVFVSALENYFLQRFTRIESKHKHHTNGDRW